MEKPSATKKKKRRTRKCLDEIRRRSRRLPHSKCIGHKDKQHMAEELQAQNNLVTINRLTLNMFPRAIRSETITRPALQEIQQSGRSYSKDSDKNKVNSHTGSLQDNVIECLNQCNSPALDKSMPLFMSQEITGDNLCTNQSDVQLTNNLNSVSPRNIHSTISTPKFNEALMHPTTTTSPVSPVLDNVEHRYQFFIKFRDELSSHIQRVTSKCFKDDFLKSPTINFKKLYNNIQFREYNKKLKNHQNYIQSKESIIQNPLDYLRLQTANDWGTPTKSQPNTCTIALGNRESPEALELHSPSLLFSADLEYKPNNECSALYETPEYNYYPHRLN